MIVLGIDPGYALMGWGVVESEGSRMRLINYGCVETKAGHPMQEKQQVAMQQAYLRKCLQEIQG